MYACENSEWLLIRRKKKDGERERDDIVTSGYLSLI